MEISCNDFSEKAIENMKIRLGSLNREDADMEFLHTFYFAKLAMALICVKKDQIGLGSEYAFEMQPFEECPFVREAIDVFREYIHFMKSYKLMYYYPMDLALLKKLAVHDTFYDIMEKAE